LTARNDVCNFDMIIKTFFPDLQNRTLPRLS
jgi:hypothetical protein